MSSRYTDIIKGLEEALAYTKGELKNVKVHKATVLDINDYTPQDVKKIRIASGMTQGVFAMAIGVTTKAVEAWEGGRSHPDGAARRILGLMEANPNFAYDVGIIKHDPVE